MTDTARVENSVVTQVWRNTELSDLVEPPSAALMEFPSGVVVAGMKYEAGALSVLPPLAAAFPSEVSAAQAKLALDAAGLLDDVEAMIAAHPVRAVRIWYANANVWQRSHPYVAALGLEMSLDDDAIDVLLAAADRY